MNEKNDGRHFPKPGLAATREDAQFDIQRLQNSNENSTILLVRRRMIKQAERHKKQSVLNSHRSNRITRPRVRNIHRFGREAAKANSGNAARRVGLAEMEQR
jgi:hypothetical protein